MHRRGPSTHGSRWSALLPAAVLALALPGAASSQLARAGAEFQVNSYTVYDQFAASVGIADSGAFVVAWESNNGQDGHYSGVFAQRFSSTGARVAVEFQVNSYTTGTQTRPRVAVHGSGSFVVVWQSYGQDGSGWGLFGRRFSSSGSPLGSEFLVNEETSINQEEAAVSMAADGRFVVAWRNDLGGADYKIVARPFDANANPQAVEFFVEPDAKSDQRNADVAVADAAQFVVVWTQYDDDRIGIFGRRFDSAGAAVGAAFQVNVVFTEDQQFSSVDSDAAGDFVVVWQSYKQDGQLDGIFGRRFDSAGAALANEFQINTYTPIVQSYPAVTVGSDGDFVVAWQSFGNDGNGFGVFAQPFDASGAPVGGELQVNTHTSGYQRLADVAQDDDGDFVVAWQSRYQDNEDSSEGVFAQRFTTPIALDIDGDGAFLPLTDGLLVLRYGFGFRGATLITAAVGPGCTRCTAPPIEAFLAELTE